MRLHLDYAIQAKCPYLKGDIHYLEKNYIAATTWMKSLRGLIYEERLQILKLMIFGKWLCMYLMIGKEQVAQKYHTGATIGLRA